MDSVNKAARQSSRTKAAVRHSKQSWIQDLQTLLSEAQKRFSDVCWSDSDGQELVWAHKAILYARSPGSFLAKFISGPPLTTSLSVSSSLLNLPASNPDRRPDSPSSAISSVLPTQSALCPLPLKATDRALLHSLLEFLYTAQGAPDALLSFLYEEQAKEQDSLGPAERLAQDMLFMWRSKLYADVQLQLTTEGGRVIEEGHFVCHRFVLIRAPYFKTILLSAYSDSTNQLLKLPCPPFTPAVLHFVLGYLYCGCLHFSNRMFDFPLATSIWRCAMYLNLEILRNEVEAFIESMTVASPKPDPIRCAKLLVFTLSPDVNCPVLRIGAEKVVVDHFGEAWREDIASLNQVAQQDLVNKVCNSLSPTTAVQQVRNLLNARSKLQSTRVQWAKPILAMLEPIESRLIHVAGSNVQEFITSLDFSALLEGRTFSSDVLEACLTYILRGLQESTSALAYQAIVGSILLRKDGIQMDARVLVEDCRQSILKNIKSRWLSMRDARAFDTLELGTLREIAEGKVALRRWSKLIRKVIETSLGLNELLSSKHDVQLAPQGASNKMITKKRTDPIDRKTAFSHERSDSKNESEGKANVQNKDTSLRPKSSNRLDYSPGRARNLSLQAGHSTKTNKTRDTSGQNSSTAFASPSSFIAPPGRNRHPTLSMKKEVSEGLLPADVRKPLVSSASLRTLASPGTSSPDRKGTTHRQSSDSLPTVSKELHPLGTCLNVGIRCVVSFPDGKKATGSVLYIGPVRNLGSGNFVGLEVDDLDQLKKDMAWCDGVVDGVRYFTLSQGEALGGLFVRPKQVMFLL